MSYGEREAIAALRGGDIGGLEALVSVYQLRAMRTAFAITGNRQAAEDVVADAFVAAYERIGQFDERRPFAPWFYRIVVNGALKAVRGAGRRVSEGGDGGEWLASIVDEAPGPEEETLTGEMRRMLLEAIYALPPVQRAALVLRYYLDMDEAAIARTLGCPQGTVKWRLHTGRDRLRRSLASELGTLAV
ncbi:MAG: RNA polymerase sigma factor [Chloroflexia bacterium]